MRKQRKQRHREEATSHLEATREVEMAEEIVELPRKPRHRKPPAVDHSQPGFTYKADYSAYSKDEPHRNGE